MRKEVIIIMSPDASRTGAPILLLRYLEWAKVHSDLNFVIILGTGGELYTRFEKIGTIFLWDNIVSRTYENILLRVIFKFIKKISPSYSFSSRRFIKKLKTNFFAKTILANTAVNGKALKMVKDTFNCKTITYIHEGYKLLKSFNQDKLIRGNIESSDVLILVSEFISRGLSENYKLNQPIHLLGGCVNNDIKISNSEEEIKKNLGIPFNKDIVMCCGYLTWHKGTDVFIQLILQLSKLNDEIHFVWLGGNADQIAYQQLLFDLNVLNLASKVSFVFSVNNSIDYINIADIFLILSREESFSLVTIEAGLLKKPVICFEGSGGPCEISGYDSRFQVPYLDVVKLSERIQELCNNKIESKEMGEYLYNIVLKKYLTSNQGKRFLDIITHQN